MDGPVFWAGLAALLAAFVIWRVYAAGRARERDRARPSSKQERIKADALETANATPNRTIRDRLRAIAKRRGDMPD